jgi:hypothetical protein
MHRFKHLLADPKSIERNQPDAFVLFPLAALPTEQRELAQWVYKRARELAAAIQEPAAVEIDWHSSVN